MKKYIGFKMIEAEPMTKGELEAVKENRDITRQDIETEKGYMVKYSDSYKSWSPKEVFEKAYMEVSNKNTITTDIVHDFVDSFEVTQMGNKTTVVKATLKNGFIIVDSSSCVDATNFDMEIGTEICKDRIYNKIWELLGFLLQTAKDGIN